MSKVLYSWGLMLDASDLFQGDSKQYPSIMSGPQVIKLCACSTQLSMFFLLSMKFILIINVKMQTVV